MALLDSKSLLGDLGIISEQEFAKILNKGMRTAQRLRRSGEGPAYIKRGRDISYRVPTVKQWLLDLEANSSKRSKR